MLAVNVALSLPETAKQTGANDKLDMVEASPSDLRFDGLRFVFTGELVQFTRSEAENLVVRQGAEVSDSVSKKVDFVVIADGILERMNEPGVVTGKLAKAIYLRDEAPNCKLLMSLPFLAMVR